MKKIFRYLVLCVGVLMLVACGKPESQKVFEDKTKEFSSFIIEKMSTEDEAAKKMGELISKATFKVNKAEEKGENSELNVTVKTVNLGKYVNEYIVAATEKFGENIPADKQEEFTKFSVDYFSNLVNNKDLEYVENDVNVHMQKIDGEWQIVDGQELMSAILGGAGSLIGF